MTYKLLTHQGNREYNEDSAVCVESSGNYCFVVADGLGGHGKGEVASQKLVEVFKREFEAAQPHDTRFLPKAFETAQDEIMLMQREQGTKFEMKTTAVCLTVIENKCQWGYIGDSRLYLFKKNKVRFHTLDHSVPQMLALSGEIKEHQIANHPDCNRLLRVVGVEWDSPRYELSEEAELTDCQAFLLCTDGFWECIEPKKMGAFLKKSAQAEEWAEMMMAEVQKNGQGTDMDNNTAIAVIL